MAERFRSRREVVTRLRTELRAQGATYREIARVIAARMRVNSRVAFRYAHGLTQQQVADRWNELWPSAEQPMTAKQISYWETWPSPTGRAPSPETLNRLARIYLCRAADLLDGEDYSGLDSATSQRVIFPSSSVTVAETHQAEPSSVVSRVDRCVAETASLLGDRDGEFQRLVSELVDWACRMKRRDILQWLSWAAASAAAAPVLNGLDDDERVRTIAALTEPRRVDNAVIDNIESVLWKCIRQDDNLGPQAALETVLAQRRLVRGLLPDAPASVKRRLLSLYANYNRFAGWLAFDLENYDAAAEYYELARATAHEAEDDEMGALVLCHMSHLATWRGQARIGIDHAAAAQVWANRTDNHRLRAYAADVASRAYAEAGQAHSTEYSLEKARTYLAKADESPERDGFADFCTSALLDSTSGANYLKLGRFDKAAELSERSIRATNPIFVRNIAITSLDLATGRLRGRERDLDGAVAAFRHSAQLANHNRSTRLVKSLRSTWKTFEPYQDYRPVRELHDELVGYGLVS